MLYELYLKLIPDSRGCAINFREKTTMKNILIRPFVLLPILTLLILQSTVHAQDSEVTVSTKSFGDWQVRCEQDKICVMQQQAIVQDSGQRLMQVNIAVQDDITKMTLILPLGIYLPGGAVMQIDDKDISELEISFCSQAGCVINQDLDRKWLKSLSDSDAAQVKIEFSPGEVVNVPFSTKGFTAAQASL
jgi:invasion protein IalB